MDTIDTDQMAAYPAAGWQLIPLHRPAETTTFGGKVREDGKRPLDKDWTRRVYDPRGVVQRAADEKRNAGVRLTAEQLVVDVDPRNGGVEGYARLVADLGLSDAAWPHVVTGSGGSHYYLTKPADVPTLDTLPAKGADGLPSYPGVEFKSKGRQVVAAGSVHPNGTRYEWDPFAPPLSEAPPVPAALLNLIRRPQADAAVTGGGQYDQAQVAHMLDGLDPTNFKEHQPWLDLMMACHHASNGDARSEFIEWSTRDPDFAAHAEGIGRRWDSLHADATSARVTYRTLQKLLIAAGEGGRIPRRDDAAGEAGGGDFSEPPDIPDDEVDDEGPLAKLNREYYLVKDGGQLVVMNQDWQPDEKRHRWSRMPTRMFREMLASRKVQVGQKRGGEPETKKLGDAWMEWPGHRFCRGVVFDPERDHPGYLNTWRGWGCEPRKGDWSLLQEMILTIICSGDRACYDYILNWMANLVQRPGTPGQSAVYIRGTYGAGKSTLGNALCHLAGDHGKKIASANLLTGRFNAHLEQCVFLFADEAVKPYDKPSEGMLKALITEGGLVMEGKFRDPDMRRNRLHIMGASNEEWVTPSAVRERRYFVMTVSDAWVGRVDKWIPLYDQLRERGGYEAMLFDLLTHKIPDGWDPQLSMPPTPEALVQKQRSLKPLGQFWFTALDDGVLPFDTVAGADWHSGPVRAFTQDMRDGFVSWCKAAGVNPGAHGRAIERFAFAELNELCPSMNHRSKATVPDDRPDLRATPSDRRARAVEIPSLAQCRAEFDAAMGGRTDWTESDTDEGDFPDDAGVGFDD